MNKLTTIVAAAHRPRRILVPADDGREPAYRRAQHYAIELADLSGAELLVADRSKETWADTPHHIGPLTPAEYQQQGNHHLDELFAEASARGIEVRVWVASLPTPEGFEEAVTSNDVQLAVLPDRFDRPTWTERLFGTRMAQVARAVAPGVAVVSVPRGGFPDFLSPAA